MLGTRVLKYSYRRKHRLSWSSLMQALLSSRGARGTCGGSKKVGMTGFLGVGWGWGGVRLLTDPVKRERFAGMRSLMTWQK